MSKKKTKRIKQKLFIIQEIHESKFIHSFSPLVPVISKMFSYIKT